MIVLLTIFIGAVCTSIVIVFANFTALSSVDNVIIYNATILYAGLALVAMSYPLIGYVADTSCGRFKMVISCFGLVLFSYLAAYICVMSQLILIEYYHQPDNIIPLATVIVGASALIIMHSCQPLR